MGAEYALGRRFTMDREGKRLPIKLASTRREKQAYLEHPDPHFRTCGPKTRRECLALLCAGGV